MIVEWQRQRHRERRRSSHCAEWNGDVACLPGSQRVNGIGGWGRLDFWVLTLWTCYWAAIHSLQSKKKSEKNFSFSPTAEYLLLLNFLGKKKNLNINISTDLKLKGLAPLTELLLMDSERISGRRVRKEKLGNTFFILILKTMGRNKLPRNVTSSINKSIPKLKIVILPWRYAIGCHSNVLISSVESTNGHLRATTVFTCIPP